ncbi:MAG TPA: HAD hydrolase-like protein [Spirochaetota bacterium]|nr:HAD hydrolase-like protein [Spirochaetota bacterium]
MGYEYFIFDLDGTLINSENSICLALNKTLNYYGLDGLDFNYSKKFIGTPLKKVLEKLSLDPEEAIKIYRPIYFELMKTHQFLYDGILDVLTKLKSDKTIILATNKGRSGADLSLEYVGLENIFHLTVTESDVENLKPSTDMFDYIKRFLSAKKQKLDFDNADFLMIGDSPVDFEFARNSNIDFALAEWGFYDLSDFSGNPDYVLKNASDILGL